MDQNIAENILLSPFKTSWKKKKKCQFCCLEFSQRNTNDKFRRPFLLQCGHSICEKCLHSKFKAAKKNVSIICEKCQVKSSYPNDKPFKDQVELNVNLFGELNIAEFVLPHWSRQRNSVKPYNFALDPTTTPPGKDVCFECGELPTDHLCVQCDVPFCKRCFNVVHRFSKTLQTHALVLLSSKKNKSDKNTCRDHKSLTEHYCNDCGELTCSACNTQKHHSHEVTSVYQENVLMKSKLDSAIAILQTAKQYNENGSQEIKKTVQKLQNFAIEAVAQIGQHFDALHGIVQNAESGFLDAIKNHMQVQMHDAETVEKQLNESHKKYEEKIASLTHYSINLPKYRRVYDLIEESNTFLENVPCFAQIRNKNENPFIFEHQMADMQSYIQEHHTLTCKAGWMIHEFQTFLGSRNTTVSSISNGSDKAVGVTPAEKDESDVASTTIHRKQQSAAPKLSPPGLHYPIVKRQQKQPALSEIRTVSRTELPSCSTTMTASDGSVMSNKTVIQRELSLMLSDSDEVRTTVKSSNSSQMSDSITTQKIKVSHIKTPQHFYVQNQTFLNSIDKMNLEYLEAAQNAHRPDNIEEGQIYLVQSRNKFYRVKVLNAETPDEHFRSKFNVQYIDYGNCEVVNHSRFRTITDDLKRDPCGAILCAIYNLAPKSEEFTMQAVALMTTIVANQLMVMIVIQEGEPHEVDLISTNSEYPVSVRDVILYRGWGTANAAPGNARCEKKFKQLCDYKENLFKNTKTSFYSQSIRAMATVEVQIVNTVTPQEFYAVVASQIPEYELLKAKMNEHYARKTEKIHLPRQNMLCAAKAADNKWYRAKIMGVLKGMCEVFFVDLGQQVQVHAKNIRTLDPSFQTAQEATLNCTLADIRPFKQNNYKFTDEALSYFKSRTEMAEKVHLTIIETSKLHGFVVTLYIVKPHLDICVNGLLVRKGFAESTGEESRTVEIPKYDDDILPTEQTMVNLSGTLGSVLCSGQVNLRAVVANKKKKNKKDLRCKVNLVKITSPGKFRVVLQKHVTSLDEISRQIQSLMEKNAAVQLKGGWNINDYCLAFAAANPNEMKKWHRAKVANFASGDQYKVYLRDAGSTVEVQQSCLADCPQEFIESSDGVVLCHLGFVQTTSGTEKWSNSSIDELKNIIDDFEEIAMSLHEKPTGPSIPVILWGMKTFYEDPFSPSVPKWYNLNKILVERGFARQLEPLAALTELDDCMDIEEQIFSKGSNFDKWLATVIERTPFDQQSSDDIEEAIPIESWLMTSLTTDFTPIKQWLPATPIQKTIFHGEPTFVDNNGVIYLHDELQKPLMDHLKKIINDAFVDDAANTTTTGGKKKVHFQKGEPCIALYHLDCKFYRATILRVQAINNYVVQFVDYGNIEAVQGSDLRKNVVAGNVPIQATKYRLADVCPVTTDDSKKWPIETLDGLHSVIVGRQCIIRVARNHKATDEVIPCLIKVLDIDTDVSELLVKRMLIDYDKTYKFHELEDITYDPYAEETVKPLRSRQRVLDECFVPNEADRTYDDLKSMFDKIQLAEIDDIVGEQMKRAQEPPDFETYTPSFWRSQNYGRMKRFIDYESPVEDNNECEGAVGSFTRRAGALKAPANVLDETVETNLFDPLATSSQVGSRASTNATPTDFIYDLTEVFPVLVLPPKQNGFWCEVTQMKNSFEYYVCPDLTQHRYEHTSMQKTLQMVGNLKKKPVNEYDCGVPCLALFKGDGRWYRAILQYVDLERQEASVLYVDYMNVAIIKLTETRKLPPEFRNIPLRNIPVHLWGVKLNPRIRESDIAASLISLFEGKRLFCRIRANETKVPQVEFYTDESLQLLAYDALFDNRFLIAIA